MLVSCLDYCSTLKMEATCSSETSLNFQRATQCYTGEDTILYDHLCENLISYTVSGSPQFSKIFILVTTNKLTGNLQQRKYTSRFKLHIPAFRCESEVIVSLNRSSKESRFDS
jgi:hypothetical protein